MASEEGMTAQAVYRSIKARLMAGEFKAGEKLRPDVLKESYGISSSAMREVLLRLAHEHLVSQEEQRGFHVPVASEKRLTELMNLRILLECEGARLSIKHGDLEWEARLNAAHHKLAHIEAKMRAAGDITEFVPIWTRIDWEFHDTLLSACPSDTLRAIHRNIYEQFRQQVVAELESAGFREATVPEHEAILVAAIRRDVAACHAALNAHLQTYRDDLRDRKTA
ncbi:GntR family transcriptional regulator [Zhengella mangrovi]|uniref:GntR family transcriptional regulator n=1 Tax=Zhengella mangrovi TaxID=1982044 RepID=A0A2G1QKJ8_9HYPH|nr:GntR family transcriptional regulator [Zhengella mangrovi]PHP66022.1 GntR family transcriptional regulator [Zhengella mangrovi]